LIKLLKNIIDFSVAYLNILIRFAKETINLCCDMGKCLIVSISRKHIAMGE